VVILELVDNWDIYNSDGSIILLSNPILITRNSNPRVLANFSQEKAGEACYKFDLIDTLDSNDMTSKTQTPGIVVHFKEINQNND
jgi:hypothetical protein